MGAESILLLLVVAERQPPDSQVLNDPRENPIYHVNVVLTLA
jgi:hypothetical protein